MSGTCGTVVLRDVVQEAAARLRSEGLDTPQLDAELLAAHVLGIDRVQLRVQSDRSLTADELRRLQELVARRLNHEPVQYILGRAWFRRLELVVDPRVLIPRPETELLVELAVEEAQRVAREQGRPATVLDLCTGSGAVALAIADEARHTAEVTATDVSADALEVAATNRQRAGVEVELLAGDLFEPVGGRRFDVIVSNPPYIPQAQLDTLPRAVREHEPHVALIVPGADHSLLVRRIAAGTRSHLRPGGLLALEIGQGQEQDVATVLADHRFGQIDQRRDLQDIVRVVCARAAQGQT